MRGGSGQDGTEDGRGWNNILKKGKKGGEKEGEGREGENKEGKEEEKGLCILLK